MALEDKYLSFINDINELAKKYEYDCTFDCTFVFDSGFDLIVHVDDTTFEL